MSHTQSGMSPWTVRCQSADVVFNYEVANASRRWGYLLSKGFSEVAREEVISQLSPKHSNFSRPHFIGELHLGSLVKSFHGIQKKVKLLIKSPFQHVRKLKLPVHVTRRNDRWDLSSGESFGTYDTSCTPLTRSSQAWTSHRKEGCRHPLGKPSFRICPSTFASF